MILAISILFGTIFPLIYESITAGKKISVGAPYFEAVLFPFALALGAYTGVSALFRVGQNNIFYFPKKINIGICINIHSGITNSFYPV